MHFRRNAHREREGYVYFGAASQATHLSKFHLHGMEDATTSDRHLTYTGLHTEDISIYVYDYAQLDLIDEKLLQ